MIGLVVVLLVATTEFALSSALGLPHTIGVVAAIGGGAFAAALWMGGLPRGGSAPGPGW
jgi:hypothetical protein